MLAASVSVSSYELWLFVFGFVLFCFVFNKALFSWYPQFSLALKLFLLLLPQGSLSSKGKDLMETFYLKP